MSERSGPAHLGSSSNEARNEALASPARAGAPKRARSVLRPPRWPARSPIASLRRGRRRRGHRRPGAGRLGRRRPPSGSAAPRSELLYGATALGLWTFAHSRYRVAVLGARDLRMQPGLLLVSTHRASGDVPILCGSLYFPARVWAERRWHPHFVARDEFFERGFLAGYPANSPLWLRRLLYPISLASGLSRARTLSLCSGKTMKLAQALAQLPPDTPLVQVLPPPLLEQVRARAQRLHASPPATARALLRGEYADLLWETVTAQELSAPQLARVWRLRRAQARESMGALSDLVRSGQPLLMFPEGNHSPDGEIGPLRPGLGVLVSDGAPQALAYMAIAYDPLTLGRPRAFLSFNAPLAPPAQDVVAEALHELKRAMPLSCGQVLGYALVQASAAGHTSLEVRAIERRIAVAAQVASQLGRRIDPALGDAKGIRRRLDDGLAALARRHGVALQGRRVVFDSERIRDDEVLLRLAREYASARGILLSSPAPPARRERRPAPRAAGA